MGRHIIKNNNSDRNCEIILQLLAAGLNNKKLDIVKVNSISVKDWEEIFLLSKKYDIVALLSDVISENKAISVPIDVRLKILGMQEIVEQSYHYHLNVVSELLAFFSSHKIPTMVMKGLSLSRYYPVPSHRKCGDIDIYQYEQQSRSDQLITQKYGIPIKNTIAGHHTSYLFRNISIENHYQIITTYRGGLTIELEALLEMEALNASDYDIYQQKVKFPSPNFNAIFLPYHMAVHFQSEKVTIRQVLDWMLFLNNEYANVNWPLVSQAYDKFNLFSFINGINGVLIHHLGMSDSLAYQYKRDEQLENRLLIDILRPSSEYKKNLINRVNHIWFKYVQSGWKFRLFKKHACIIFARKLVALILHHDDFNEHVISLPNT